MKPCFPQPQNLFVIQQQMNSLSIIVNFVFLPFHIRTFDESLTCYGVVLKDPFSVLTKESTLSHDLPGLTGSALYVTHSEPDHHYSAILADHTTLLCGPRIANTVLKRWARYGQTTHCSQPAKAGKQHQKAVLSPGQNQRMFDAVFACKWSTDFPLDYELDFSEFSSFWVIMCFL
jgi:hypothetical protein